jgi:hypothetical protein
MGGPMLSTPAEEVADHPAAADQLRAPFLAYIGLTAHALETMNKKTITSSFFNL